MKGVDKRIKYCYIKEVEQRTEKNLYCLPPTDTFTKDNKIMKSTNIATSIRELKAMAKAVKLPKYSSLTKQELLKALLIGQSCPLPEIITATEPPPVTEPVVTARRPVTAFNFLVQYICICVFLITCLTFLGVTIYKALGWLLVRLQGTSTTRELGGFVRIEV